MGDASLRLRPPLSMTKRKADMYYWTLNDATPVKLLRAPYSTIW
jgi:hypothetical protein